MKATRAARRLLRVRALMAGIALIAIFGLELAVGQSLAARIGQTKVGEVDVLPACNVGMADCFLGLR